MMRISIGSPGPGQEILCQPRVGPLRLPGHPPGEVLQMLGKGDAEVFRIQCAPRFVRRDPLCLRGQCADRDECKQNRHTRRKGMATDDRRDIPRGAIPDSRRRISWRMSMPRRRWA